MKNILLQLTVPFPSEENVPVSAMIFHSWLPYKDEQSILIIEKNYEIKIEFNINSTIWASDKKLEDIHKWVNVTVHRVFINVIIKNVEDQLVQFMQENISEDKTPNPELRKQFEVIGKEILDIIFYYLNRLISYVRFEKGQFWLNEFPKDYDMHSYYIHFDAKAKILEDGAQWFRWRPTHTIHMNSNINLDIKCYLEELEWDGVKEFIFSKTRPNLVLELLSKAENLARNDHRRNAIIDSVSALEIALFAFSKNPSKTILNNYRGIRDSFESLQKHIEHLGFSSSIRYLVPILFNNEQILTEDLQNCSTAIEIRNNVIHHGQRDIDEKLFYKLFKSIKNVCIILNKYAAT